MMEGKPIQKDSFRRMAGKDVGIAWLTEDETAMTEPIVVMSPEGLDMTMPPASLTVEDVAAKVGPEKALDVIGMFHL